MKRYNKSQEKKIAKIMRLFCLNVEATKTAELTGFNRNTINSYYKLFRESIVLFQTQEVQKIIGIVEVDESYFGLKRLPKHEGNLYAVVMACRLDKTEGMIYNTFIVFRKSCLYVF